MGGGHRPATHRCSESDRRAERPTAANVGRTDGASPPAAVAGRRQPFGAARGGDARGRGAQGDKARGSDARGVELRIPAIGVATSLSTLGLNLDGTVQVPIIPQRAGWFRLGPTPGQVGSAVILGHVDSYDGPAVFYRLRYLQPGDQVAVSLADGAVAHFAVTKVETYPNEDFPARQVYASHGESTLQLVTCGGEFDTATGYQANVVIYTSLVATTPAPVVDAASTTPLAMTGSAG